MLSKYFFELLHSNSLNFFRASAALWSTSTLKWRRRSMGSRRKNDASLWPLLSFYHQDLPAHREDSFFQCFFQDSRQAVYHNKPFFKVFYVPVHETCYLKSSSILLVSTVNTSKAKEHVELDAIAHLLLVSLIFRIFYVTWNQNQAKRSNQQFLVKCQND